MILDDVTVLRWPAEAEMRARLADRGAPCLLVGEHGAAPELGTHEDWIAGDATVAELLSRAERLGSAVEGRVPRLDEDGLLRVDQRWVSFSDVQLPVVDLLVKRFGSLVTTDEVASAYRSAGGTVGSAGLRGLALRIRVKVAGLDLHLHSVHRKGFVLDWAPELVTQRSRP